MKNTKSIFIIISFTIICNSIFSQRDSSSYINSKKFRKIGLTIGGFIRPVKTLKEDYSFPYRPYDKAGNLDESKMYRNALGNAQFLNYLSEISYTTRRFDCHILGFIYTSKSFFPDPGGVGAGSGLVRLKNYDIYYEFQWTILKPKSINTFKCNSPYIGLKVLYSNKYLNYYLITEDVSSRINETSLINYASLASMQPTLGYKLVWNKFFTSFGFCLNAFTFLKGKYIYDREYSVFWNPSEHLKEEKNNTYSKYLVGKPSIIDNINIRIGFKI